MKKIIRVNCNTGSINAIPEGEVYGNLGGRSLTSHVLSEEVDPACDPLGPENKVIIAGMLLSGTPISTTNRLSVGAKSPLTGGIKESNVGGNVSRLLSAHGIKAIILEDAPEVIKMRILLIKADGSLSLVDASDIAGKRNYESFPYLMDKYGKDSGVLAIGMAGERFYKNSSIHVSEMPHGVPSRAAARGGLASVLASKGIKALVVQKPDKKYEFEYVDAEAFKKASAGVNKNIYNNRSVVSTCGTVGFLGATVPSNMLPYKNFNGEMLSEKEAEEFNVANITQRINAFGGKSGQACQPGCIVKCSNCINDADGNYITSGFEYETLALFGPNCKIFDLEAIVRMDRFCDDIGMDTIETGVCLGIYMEAGKLEWGDSEGAMKLLESFYEGGEDAYNFGLGAGLLGKKLGVKRIPAVKNQGMAAYDPRGLKGTGTTYAISTMGADHTAGSTISNRVLKPSQKEGQLEASIALQSGICACDSFGCLLAWGSTVTAPDLSDALAAALGGDWSVGKLMGLGAETLKKEREFNAKAGLTPDDDRIPEYMCTEPNASGSVYDITHEEILEKWYGQA